MVFDREVRALVCARVPLVIVVEADGGSCKGSARFLEEGLVVIRARDLSAREYSVERSVLEKVFAKAVSTNVDLRHCSISEMWWATV